MYELRGNIHNRLLDKAMQLISTYGNFFIQFPRFTYLRVGGFEGEPYKLNRYAFDRQILMEMCRQLAYIDTKYRAKHWSGVSFPIELTYFICNSVSDALNLELELKKLNLQLYGTQANFDAKGFVVAHLTLRKDFTHVPNMEDFWVDCCDEFEVRKRAHQRFTL